MEKYIFTPQQAGMEAMKQSKQYTGVYAPVKKYNSIEECIMLSGHVIYSYYPFRAVYSNEGGRSGWIASKTKCISLSAHKKTGILTLNEGEHYQETEAGVLQKLKKGGSHKICNIRIRILKIVDSYHEEGICEHKLICSIFCDKWDNPKELVMKKEEYAQFFDIAKKKFPEIMLMTNSKNSITEYLADVYAEANKNCQKDIEIIPRGWFELNGKVIFAKGTSSAYATAPIPNIEELSLIEKQDIYKEGINFLEVGDRKSEISVMFLFAHMGFSAYWFEKGGLPCRFCLYLNGPSGALKTSTANVIANVFEADLSKKNLRFTATDASLKNILHSLRDTTILVDDYSATEAETKKHGTTIMENIIRIVGDGVLPSKMGFGGPVQRKLRAAVIMTGEDDAGLAESSVLRCVNLSIKRETFSGKHLMKYQGSEILKKYFALYVKFLELYGNEVKVFMEKYLVEFRERYTNISPRLRDAAIVFEVQIMLLKKFGEWVGITEEEVTFRLQSLSEGVQTVIFQNNEAQKILPVDQLFLIGLMQSIGSYPNMGLAESEKVYSGSEASFLGFEEKDTGYIWVDFTKAYILNQDYWKRQGRPFLKSAKKVKECLAEAGLIEYRKSESSIDYLIKSKRGRRKRMLVLIKNKVDEKMSTIKI